MRWLFLIGLFLLSLLSYLALDKQLAHLFYNPHWTYNGLALLIAPPLYLLITGALSALSKQITPSFILMLTIYAITGVLKIAVGRARPNLFITTGFYGFEPWTGLSDAFRSFPSSHVAVAFGLCALWIARKQLKAPAQIALYTAAAALSSARLFSGCHYLSDIIAGASIGLFAAHMIPFLEKQIGQAMKLVRS